MKQSFTNGAKTKISFSSTFTSESRIIKNINCIIIILSMFISFYPNSHFLILTFEINVLKTKPFGSELNSYFKQELEINT